MKKFLKALMLTTATLLNQFSFGQNLVPNPSFEVYGTCPDNLDQVNYAIGWSSFSGTPDYYNACCDTSTSAINVSVPQNYFDYQPARTGNAYSSILTKSTSLYYRENIGITLIQPLIVGHEYFVSFYASRVGNVPNHFNGASNKLGVRLSNFSYSFPLNNAPIDNYAQVYTDSIITDTLGWTEISGFFIADSAYEYLIVGNFFQDSLTSFVAFDSLSGKAYYYIDDVNLIDSIPTGINELYSHSQINIYPNITSEWVTIEGSGFIKIILSDIFGRVCFILDEPSSNIEGINVSTFNKGIYFLTLQSIGYNITRKIIIQ